MDLPSWRIASLTAMFFSLLSSNPQSAAQAPEAVRAEAAVSRAPSSVVYEVQPGDTLWKIVERFDVDLDQLLALNQSSNLHRLHRGMKIRVPEKPSGNLTSEPVLAPQTEVMFSRSGEPIHYNRVLNCTLTAYTAGSESTGKSPGDKGYGITFSGTTATEGRTVAVDPTVIPIGSKIYIEGIGYRIAEDTGGAIKGGHIDVFFNDVSTAVSFGVKEGIKVALLQ